ncbi:hypothetical protein J7L68_07860 [bacterium]|nr:hypothetical protein [bacterium]
MRIVKFSVLAIMAMMFMYFTGCSDSPTGPGDNDVLQIKFYCDTTWIEFSEYEAWSVYSSSNNITTISATDTSTGEIFNLIIPSNDENDWELDNNDTLSLLYISETDTFASNSGLIDDGAELNVSISFYGPVGGTVEGTFSGTVVNSSGTEQKDITSGTFKVRRISDMD